MTTRPRPVIFTWTDDGTMVPLVRYKRICDQQFVVGEEYPLQIVESRNMNSHRHYFATIHSAWENLPEHLSALYPTHEALRAKALVETHFCTERDYVCDTQVKARHLATIIRNHSPYSVIKVSGNIVKVFEPKSQSLSAMSADEFRASKTAVLDWIESLNPRVPMSAIKKEAAKVAPPDKKDGLKNLPAVHPGVAAPAGPRNAVEYYSHACEWIDKSNDERAAHERWKSEETIRTTLKVSDATVTELLNRMDYHFSEPDKA